MILGVVGLAGCGKSAQDYLNRGNQLYAAGKYDDADINYRNAIKKAPDSGEAYYRLGLTALRKGDANNAYQSLRHAVTLDRTNNPAKVELANLCLASYARDPRHPAAVYNQAQTMADQLVAPGGNRAEGLRIKGTLALFDNHPGMAIDLFRQGVQAAPNDPEIAVGLAQAYLRDNQPQQGEQTARQIVASHPQFAAAYEVLFGYYAGLKQWDTMEQLLKQWSANLPKDSQPLIRLAGLYYDRKQPDKAEAILQSIENRPADFPQGDLLVGDFHALIHKQDLALADYQRGASRDAKRLETYQQRTASMLYGLGRRDEALQSVNTMLAKNPKDLFARTLKIQLLDDIGGPANLTAAASLAGEVAKEAPANVRIQMLAGQALMKKGSPEEALTYFQQAAKADPKSVNVQVAMGRAELVRKNYAAVLQHANSALAIRPTDTNARLLRVIGLTGTHAYAEAQTDADQLARDTKDAPQVEMQLGLIALGQGHFSQAEAHFGKLYRDGSLDLEPLAGLVNTYEAEHQPDRALALMETEARKSPDSPQRATLLAATEEAAGKTDMALAELQKQAAAHPASAEPHLQIAQLDINHGKFDDALAELQRAKQLEPQRPGVDVAIANVEDRLGRKQEAIASYRKALVKSPDNPLLLNNLAFLLADTGGNLTEAQQMITTAIRKASNLPQLQDTLAWVMIKQRNANSALQLLTSLTNKYPDNATYRYHYAVALINSGNRSAAKLQAETALAKKPSAETEAALRTLLTQVQ